ncbi:MAG: exopolysaccharide biosynthesis polyprenyl glycosylphosphotransferase [Ruminococcus sp.]|nr:exopolysaccharide biosynthesis polyprenyl glycosylphosphotransferase [Ruminococcus sp.]
MPMNKRKDRDQYKRIYSFFAAIVLLGIFTAAFGWVWYECYSDTILLPFYRRGNWVMIAIYVVLMLLFSSVFGGLKTGYLKRTDSFYSQSLSMLCVNVVTYFQVSLIARDFVDAIPFVLMTLGDIAVLPLWILVTNKLYFSLYPPRRLVIIYGERAAADLVTKMSRRVDKYMICESVSASQSWTEMQEAIDRYEGVILCDMPGQIRNDILKYCFAAKVRVYVAPKISDIIIRGAEEIRLFDTPLLLCRNGGLSLEQRFVKRIFDLTFAVLLGVVCLPISLIVALCIKLEDGGPVLYKQKRLTIDDKVFEVYKFRSMIQNAEANGPQLATETDSRITKVGRVLRKCRLDEIPQLLNILRGDMSVVGPRPERPELALQYEETMPEFDFRLRVKAGLTGYAQVTGLYDTVPYDKLKMDMMYIEQYSLLLDLRIIMMTLKIALFPGESNEEASRHEQQHINSTPTHEKEN